MSQIGNTRTEKVREDKLRRGKVIGKTMKFAPFKQGNGGNEENLRKKVSHNRLDPTNVYVNM